MLVLDSRTVWALTLTLAVVTDDVLSLFVLIVRNDRARSLRIGRSECNTEYQDLQTKGHRKWVTVNLSPFNHSLLHLLIGILGFDCLLEGIDFPLSHF